MMTKAAELFRCAACGENALDADSSTTVTCRRCGWEKSRFGPIIDLYEPTPTVAHRKTDDPERLAKFLAHRIGLTDDSAVDEIVSTLYPLPTTQRSAFDAEENLFRERFNIENELIITSIEQAYLPAAFPANSKAGLAIRLRNCGSFALSSAATPPFLISYHWLKHNQMEIFEGLRTALPVRLEPGSEVTIPMQINTPPLPGDYTLRIEPLLEGKEWLGELAHDLDVIVEVAAAPCQAAVPAAPTVFSETEDGNLAARFVDANIELRDGTRVIEIGGGIAPAFMDTKAWCGFKGVFVNNDISLRLLRIAYTLSQAKHGSQASSAYHVRFDATRMPIPDATFDVALFCRSLHHFEDIPGVLREVRRVLRPGGQLFLLCEPVAMEYDDHIRSLIARGVNEQVFPPGVIENVVAKCGYKLQTSRHDWGFSFKGAFERVD